MRERLQDRIASDALQLLEAKPMSIVEISKELDANYYTTRNAVMSLMEDGQVVTTGNGFRNVKLKLSDGEGPNRIMPYLRLGDEKHKLIRLLGMRHDTNRPASFDAITNLPRHITRILRVATALKDTNDSQDRTLRVIRSSMESDLEKIDRVASLYRQILDNPKNWNPEFLRRYNNDVDFNIDEVNAAHAFYFNED